MRILVTAASRHSSTREIAQAIADALSARGADVLVRPPEDCEDLTGLDAVVLGSAVYMGAWLAPAIDFADRHGTALRALPVWLFSSGPVGSPPRPAADDAVKLHEHLVALGARDHQVFAGRLDRHALGFGERAVMFAFGAEAGDVRDWEAIVSWADGIFGALGVPRSTETAA